MFWVGLAGVFGDLTHDGASSDQIYQYEAKYDQFCDCSLNTAHQYKIGISVGPIPANYWHKINCA